MSTLYKMMILCCQFHPGMQFNQVCCIKTSSTARFRLEMLSDGVSEHQIFINFPGGACPQTPYVDRLTCAGFAIFGGSAPPQTGKCSYTYGSLYIEDWKFKGISSHTSRPLPTINILVKHKEQSVIILFCEI